MDQVVDGEIDEMPPSKFRERAAKIAERFLHTVVLIDDEAYRYFRQTESGKVQKIELVEPQLLPGGDQKPVSEPPSASAAKDDVIKKALETAQAIKAGTAQAPVPAKGEGVEAVLSSEEKPVVAAIENATDAEIDQGLNSRKLVANFARHGLVCGVIEPEVDGKDLDQLLAAAQRADVLIVDWVFNDDNGKLAQKIVKSVLAKDSPERLRLIIIYTGDQGIAKVLDELKKDAAKGLASTWEKNVLASERTRIAVLSKVTSPKNKGAVSLDELPDRVLVEFAALYSGLVTNAAMEGLAILRNNTHQLLGRLHKQLDVAFLTHRMLLPQPDDAQEFLTDLVGQEIASLLHSHEIGGVSDMAAIEEWFEVSGKNEPTASKELTAALEAKEDQRLELLRTGAPEFLKAKVTTKDKQRELEEKLHKSGSHMFLDPSKRPTDLDHELAYVASMVHRYENPHPPRLTLGTVFVSAAGEYLVCIQPVCDCVRVKEPRRFAFLVAEKSGAPNLLIKQGTTHVRLKVLNRVAGLVQHTFGPTDGKDVVYGVAHGDEFQFKTVDEKVFTWRGQLKFPQAQRLTQQFSALLARVGLDESEWWRRFDRAGETGPIGGEEHQETVAAADPPAEEQSSPDKKV